MNDLREYAAHWFQHTVLRVAEPRFLTLTTERIREMEEARPGFGVPLREVAIDSLAGTERELVHRALAVLTVLGTKEDLTRIETLAGHTDSWIANAARTAAFEIAHRAV